jgi:polyisoprenoid-binding protein YceI
MAWVIDNAHTSLGFSAKHMMISTVRGRFTKFTGTLNVDTDNLTLSSVEGAVETASVDTNEPNRDAHLRSADFFDAEKFPVMTFKSTRITAKGDDSYDVAGLMTIKDITKEVVFKVSDEGRSKDPWGNLRLGVSALGVINRKDFGLTWNVALETGGWLVADQIKLNIELEAMYQVEPVAEPISA